MTHPITPPPELLKQWEDDWFQEQENADVLLVNAYAAGALAGADAELDACCEEMKSIPSPFGIPFGEMASNALRAARRPKPPSAVAQAEALIERYEDGWCPSPAQWHVIREGLAEGRRALEQIDD
jgi:hypothetical protein